MLGWPPRMLRRADPPEETRRDTVEVVHEGATYTVALRRNPNARRLILRVRTDTGGVELTVPQRTALSTARTFAIRHGGWIAARLARMPERLAFAPGALIPLRGVPHRLERVPGPRGAIRVIQAGAEEPPVLAIPSDAEHFSRRVLDYFKAEAAKDLSNAARRYAQRLEVSIARVTIRDTRSRWGSCSAAGVLSFSWRIVMAPPDVLDYLAAHEVAHRIELNHSARYWALVAAICPHWRQAENWLTRHGSDLHRYGPVGERPAAS